MAEGLKLESVDESPLVEKFHQFFESVYRKEIEQLVGKYPEERSLVVEFSALEKFDFKLADDLIEHPDFLLEAAEAAVRQMEVPSLDIEEFAPHVRFSGLPDDKRVLPRELGSRHIGKLVGVDGVIKQITDVLPKLKLATWKCNRCGNVYRVPQKGSQVSQPAMCECRHRDFKLVSEDSDFIDYQKIQIQEPLELLKGNEQPTSLDIYVSDDLVNKAAPGDRIQIIGVLRIFPSKTNKLVFGRFIEAVNVEQTMQEFEEIVVSEEEEAEIKELASQPDIYEKLTKSIAPSIYGHEAVKEAITLQLFGGVQKILPNDQKIRGNIHLLLVGDPGVAKSQMLMAANNIAPKSVYVGGKTTSAVGLCVAPDSLILNNNGFREIGEFVDERFDFARAIEEAPGVFSNDAEGSMPALDSNLKLRTRNFSKVWKIRAPQKMIRVTTQSGKSIDLTPNTRLFRLKGSEFEWVKSLELEVGDFVATSRVLPNGSNPLRASVRVLEKDRNVRIKNNVSRAFRKITDKLLASKFSELQEIAKELGVSRERIYSWRSKKWYHGMPLWLFLELGRKAGFSEKELSKHVKEVFSRYGKNIKVPQYLNDERLAYLAGLLMGDGSIWLGNGNAGIRFYNSSGQLLKKFDSISRKLFGIEPEKICENGKVPGRRINSLPVFRLLAEFGLSQDKKKNRISHFVSESSNRLLASFLRGLYDTDGYVSQSENASAHVGFSTISKELARTLQLSLLKFGVQSKLRKRKREGKVSRGIITVRSNYDQYYIEIRGKKNLLAFKKFINFNMNKKRKALKEIISRTGKEDTNIDIVPEISHLLKEAGAEWAYSTGKTRPSRRKLREVLKGSNPFLQKLADSDVLWEKVTLIEEFVPKYDFVFDLTVENAHNFLANGFFVHNTATAVKDEFGEGGWTLKAGALVLASGGIVMCDELDKMDAEERVALHEAMEQGTISVAKAGIVTRFRTDTSILAAANPKFSRFDPFQPFIEQINLPPTLISRFDLFFMIRDILDRTRDSEIAAHILKTHQAGAKLFQAKRHGKKLKKAEMKEVEKIVMPVIPKDLLKKYISYARQNIFPTLSKEAIQAISDFYVGLRERGREEGSFSATHRQLEGLIRLSEASARIRLSDMVEKSDAERAIRLLKSSLRDVVTDPETGKIDIDIITSGQTHSQVETMRKILGIIREKDKETDIVPVKEVLDEAESIGVDRQKADDIIKKLERKGELYRPRHGFIKPTESK